MLIVSCALIYDDAIRACAVSTVKADRTGKFVLLTYSLTASHCSTEANLAGVPFPCFSCLIWMQQNTPVTRNYALIKAFFVKKKGTKTAVFAVLSRVAKRSGHHGHPWLRPWFEIGCAIWRFLIVDDKNVSTICFWRNIIVLCYSTHSVIYSSGTSVSINFTTWHTFTSVLTHR